MITDLGQFAKLMLVIMHKVFLFSFGYFEFLNFNDEPSQNNQGVYVTSKAEYAEKYCQEIPKVFMIGFVMVGNPFPVIEHPFMIDEEGKVMMQEIEKDKLKKNEEGYLGKPINPGYQSHFTLGILLLSRLFFFFPFIFMKN